MMLLPSELRTLVFLAVLTAAKAQADVTSAAPTSSTTPNASTVDSTTTVAHILIPSQDVNDPAPSLVSSNSETPPEPQPTDEIDVCYSVDPPDWCEEPPPFWHPEVTATGWDDWGEWNNDGIGGGGGQGFAPTTTRLRPTEETPVVVTTRTPTVIEIRTSVEPSAPGAVEGGAATPVPEPAPANDVHTENQESLAKPTSGDYTQQTGGSGGSIPQGSPPQPTPGQIAPGQLTAGSNSNMAWRQTASSGSTILDAIINQLGKVQPGAQPTPVLAPTAGVSGALIDHEPHPGSPTGTAQVDQHEPVGTVGAISEPITPGAAGIVSAHESITVGNTITLGSATLTLTPGLSTVIGTGLDITLVALQTDRASQTVITVSSSGTAITATITNAPATVTLPRTGFEASITDDAGRGVSTSRPGGGAVTTSSRGIANERRATGFTGVMLGILGFVLAS